MLLVKGAYGKMKIFVKYVWKRLSLFESGEFRLLCSFETRGTRITPNASEHVLQKAILYKQHFTEFLLQHDLFGRINNGFVAA